jgi:hypothetical protein
LDWSRCNLQTARLAIILILEILDLDSSKFFPIKVLMNLKLAQDFRSRQFKLFKSSQTL